MAKKETEVERPTEVVAEVTPDVEATPRTFDQDEVDALVATSEEKARKDEFDRLNPLLSEQGAEIKRLREQPSISSDDGPLEVLLQDKKAKLELGETDPMIPYLEGEITRRKQVQTQAKQDAYYRQTDAVYREAEGVFGDDIDALHNIRNLIRAGDVDLAEKKIAKAKSTEPKKELKENEDELKAKWIEEGKRLGMDEHGLLKTDTGGPSGSGITISRTSLETPEFQEKYLRDPEYREKVDAAWREGKIK